MFLSYTDILITSICDLIAKSDMIVPSFLEFSILIHISTVNA
jgi:hypothetical protein